MNLYRSVQLFVLLLAFCPVYSQNAVYKAGINLLPTLVGNPEVTLEASNRTWYSMNVNFGMVFKPGVYAQTKKWCNNFSVDRMTGDFVKIGGRVYPFRGVKTTNTNVDLFIGGAIIGLTYRKEGSRYKEDVVTGGSSDEKEFKTANGRRWGWAGVIGMTFVLSHKLHLEGDLGFQIGSSFKRIETFNCNGDYIPGYASGIQSIMVIKYGFGKAYSKR